MKKLLSLPEFRDYCDTISFNKIIYSSDNQSWNCVSSLISTELVFNRMLMTFNPNIIHLNNGENSLHLIRVKAVKIHEVHCMLGEVFTVVCGDSLGELNDKEYTLVAC